MPLSTSSDIFGDHVAESSHRQQLATKLQATSNKDRPLCLISSRSKRHFLTTSSLSLTSRIELSFGITSKSLLLTSSWRVFEISEFLNTVAAEMGNVLRKNDRSRTRIARLTGGRNISGTSVRTCLVWSVVSAMNILKGMIVGLD